MAEIISFNARADRAADALFGGVIRWDGWFYDAAAVVKYTPRCLVAEALAAKPRSAQDWWDHLAFRWPGSALDILGRLRAAGLGSEQIQVEHSLAVYGESVKGRRKGVAAAKSTRSGSAASSRAFMALAAKLDPEAIGDLVDQLVGHLGVYHNIAHP